MSRTVRDGLRAIQARWPELGDDCEETPLFLLAAGWRSGSTWLQRSLMKHWFLWGEPFGHGRLIDGFLDTIRAFTEVWPQSEFFYQEQSVDELQNEFIANLYPDVAGLKRAHQAFFLSLFRDKSPGQGSKNWGVKEVRWTAEHAGYLRWLFPKCKIVMLVRNPFVGYRSYAARKALGWQWFHTWPERPITATEFASHWRSCVDGFVGQHEELDAVLVKYEDLVRGEVHALSAYLGVDVQAVATRPQDGPPPMDSINAEDLHILQSLLGTTAKSLGYPDDAKSE